MSISTNALIATLRALTHEVNRVESKLAEHDSISEDEAEELGEYVNDLHEALASAADIYKTRQEADGSLTDVDLLLGHFDSEAWSA